MTIRITGTLQPAGDFPVCLVENVQDAASEGYADGAAAAAVSAIPDASASAKGLATALQIAKLDDIPTAAYAAQTFTFTGALTTNPTVYGYAVLRGTTLKWAELLAAPVTPANNGDTITVTPRKQQSTGTPVD